MNARQIRGTDIATRRRIERQGTLWLVPSQSGQGTYTVDVDSTPPTCTCPDYELSGLKCKHIYAVQYLVGGGDPSCPPPRKPKRPTYRQDWPAYNAAQTTEKAHFQKMLRALCDGICEPPRQGPGRPSLPLCDQVFSVVFKVYSTFSGRRFTGDLDDATGKGYVSRRPHYNSVFRYLESPTMTPILRALIERSALPLRGIETKFAVDSTGFTTCRFVRWYDAKYGQEMERHDWLKCHFMCGVNTNVITAVEITGAYTHDTTQFPALVTATARQQHPIYEVSADKAYSSRTNLALVERIGAEPYIPFRSNATGIYRSEDVWDRLYHFYMLRRETFLQHYHLRSLAESNVAMIKAKFGDALRSKTDTAQVNELLCKVLCHNICCVIQSMYEVGIEPDFVADA